MVVRARASAVGSRASAVGATEEARASVVGATEAEAMVSAVRALEVVVRAEVAGLVCSSRHTETHTSTQPGLESTGNLGL